MTSAIPKKPDDATWTDEQWKAIWATGQDILVSAAAGSGKTAVLINRMIEKVISSDHPIDVDQLLVVTFTNASAAEMRHRMADALEKEIKKNPTSKHLRRQLSLINKAQISTLHSFCLNIVRQYAYLLNIDPGFRIADETEAALLKDDILAQVLEAAYDGEYAERVYRLVDSFTSDRDDQAIEVLISKLYEMSRVNPEPSKWLLALPEQYAIADDAVVDDLPFIPYVKKAILHDIDGAIHIAQEIRQLALLPDGPYAYGETAEKDLVLLQEARALVSERSWQEAHSFFQKAKLDRAKAQKKGSCDEELLEMAKAKRKQVKEMFEKPVEKYFQRSPERLLDEIRFMKPMIATLVELALQFSEMYGAAKSSKGLVDFSDLEHYALAILTEDVDGKMVPSSVALDYRAHFKEVLIDEYQDVNFLQETILQLIKTGEASNGNMFMVGDVKQAIYRFRLAEPTLFLHKYLAYNEGENSGLRIDLNANFRSRPQVLHGTNYVFKQIMGEEVGEVVYDEAAALKPQAPYDEKEMPIELAILYTEENEDESGSQASEEEELKKSQQEARFMIKEIRRMMDSGMTVMDPWTKKERPIEYRDFVILMRSMTWSADLVDEFKAAEIPLYAEISKGYFEALEVMIMLNTLKTIDNPYQDIPFVSVLRAPFVGLTENELAKIRLAQPKASFYEALKQFVRSEGAGLNATTASKLQRFLLQVEDWRDLARRGSLADLIWRVYMDTNYYEMVGAMSNGKQRQANLRALHDRAIAYEKTSFRGLFRFLRFVERMRLRGNDLGTAKAISEKENVVRLMTIHSSKGLEFPFVFVAGLGREFNKMDFHLPYLFDQEFGLAVKMIDPEKRIQYTSLPFLAMVEKKTLEMKSEEMRILYVAMTRAKEKLFLLGTIKDWEKAKKQWTDSAQLPDGEMLPDYLRAKAKSYLDWIGPAFARHPHFKGEEVGTEQSQWKLNVLHVNDLYETEVEKVEEEKESLPEAEVNPAMVAEIERRFDEPYAYERAIAKRSKTSVSELKRLQQLQSQEEPELFTSSTPNQQRVAQRPAFLQQQSLTAAETGTAIHTVMQHIPKEGLHSEETVRRFVDSLVERQLLTEEEAKAVKPNKIIDFFKSETGIRFMNAQELHREMPFTLSLADNEGDTQVVQGVIDCLLKDATGKWILLDYKTDRLLPHMQTIEGLRTEMVKRYEVQLSLYKKAIEEILKIEIAEKVIYAFNANHSIQL
ncbi:helicase-exonuclease AddAB subunit AddA [Rummeliibacillus sp. G93]|uniref:helicase-exonuclease AddAB subunit AddA n=1 Tax=Rummeliibacillus sp. G93 TaxID=2939494 RepID=UPI00201C18D7|nr:helicase-exonuclease AddAB subunit AddA [Rummeliibacillus sp. G93]UQW98075.1 helicase-exonuclease AddAB subunit AddA [Rummeliibacillus sp. G93]